MHILTLETKYNPGDSFTYPFVDVQDILQALKVWLVTRLNDMVKGQATLFCRTNKIFVDIVMIRTCNLIISK